jgi:hypothetical protein
MTTSNDGKFTLDYHSVMIPFPRTGEGIQSIQRRESNGAVLGGASAKFSVPPPSNFGCSANQFVD